MIIYEKKEECYGCASCENSCKVHAITMEEDKQGFLYPSINANCCIECGKCIKTCIIHNEIFQKIERVYALKYDKAETRRECQSGGAFFALAEWIIKNNGIVYGCVWDKEFNVRHIRTEKMDEVYKMRGSKYVQSDMRKVWETIENDARSGRYVLFSGTSCQVDAVRRKLKKVDCKNVILVDLICHGVPSPLLWREHIAYLKKKLKGEINKISCRDKQFYSWGKHIEVVAYRKEKKPKYYHNRTFVNLFYSNFILRPSCYQCKYKNGNFSGDITIADFWGVEQNSPDMFDSNGVSLILTHNDKGDSILKNIKTIEITEVDNKAWMKWQMKVPANKPEQYKMFWRDYWEKGYGFVIRKYAGENIGGKLRFQIKKLMNKL